jgi:predicted GNAT superfamily acetyltransferase
MVGGSVGFFGPPSRRTIHSDVTGVRAAARDRQVGFALKLHQRAWALECGIETVTWTFDPLGSRNAYVNIAKLRARGVTYHEDFYGEMTDQINRGQGSDRLMASWRLTSRAVVWACERPAPAPAADGEAPVLLEDAGDGPVEHDVDPASPNVRVAIPADIAALRRSDPGLAYRWRAAVRETMGSELAAGGQVVAFDRGAGYVIERRDRDADHGG